MANNPIGLDQQGQPAAAKDPITCHVLDITTGLPAASMSVVLKHTYDPEILGYEPIFKAKTNTDGRITQWSAEPQLFSIEQILLNLKNHREESVWMMIFDTQGYFGEAKCFFPKVEVRFVVDNAKGGHVHVPLLMGPYSYTTYRGS